MIGGCGGRWFGSGDVWWLMGGGGDGGWLVISALVVCGFGGLVFGYVEGGGLLVMGGVVWW